MMDKQFNTEEQIITLDVKAAKNESIERGK
jgi:hypothetical protein